MTAHGANCCPVHGCHYGMSRCPVAKGLLLPRYPQNNRCSECADAARASRESSEAYRALGRRFTERAAKTPKTEPKPKPEPSLDKNVEELARAICAGHTHAFPSHVNACADSIGAAKAVLKSGWLARALQIAADVATDPEYAPKPSSLRLRSRL